MQWLIANMWIAMAAATVLGLLFGFALRGLMVGSRIRKAEVEREIAKTELTQSKAEVEALYSSQRKQKEEAALAVSGGDALAAELEDRERRITALGEELTAVRTELETLQSSRDNDSNGLETAGAALAGAVAGAVLSDGDQEELTNLRDRNAWLEERVGALESDIAAVTSAAAAPEEEAVMAAESSNGAASVADEKTRWQASYLRMRVNALETSLIAQSEADAAADAAPAITPEIVEDPDPDPAPAADAAVESGLDEELAQLRWRNRYLEGRLAYFEEAPEEVSDETPEQQPEEEIGEPADAPVEPVSVADVVDEPSIEVAETAETEATEPAADPVEDASEPELHPSEAMLAELDGKQPVQIEPPSNGGDDLTTITGIGPRIAEVLNGLGIWTFSQIAEWKPEHETWIENHLSFKGRVSRENWVGQAKDLLVTA
ncbi:MAG: hypothetical protein AAFR82_08615 [Pseudomonadota bacterium]